MVRNLALRSVMPTALAAALLVMVAACGSSGTKSSPTTAAQGGNSSSAPTLAQLAGATQKLPSLPNVTPPSGKSVWVISCGQAATGCALATGQVQAVLQSPLNWKVTVFDGKLTPTGYSAGINQALVAHADAIVLIAIDCDLVKPALQEAKTAGVPVIDSDGYDCTDPSQGGGPSLVINSDIGGSPTAGAEADGKALADYAAAQSNGTGQFIVPTQPDFHVEVVELAAFENEFKQVCSGCKIAAEVPIISADLASGAATSKFSSALLQHPSATYVAALLDPQLTYVTDALRTSGKHLPVLTVGGSAADLQLVKNGTIQGLMASDLDLGAWITADTVVRTLAKASLVKYQSPVLTLVDKNRNLPQSGGYTVPVDYKFAYTKAWGRG